MSSSTYGDSGYDNTTARRSPAEARTLPRTLALVVGAIFLLVGILGFIPGITQDFDTIEAAGHESHAELFGLFQVSILHNVVHLLFGVAGIAAARRSDWSTYYLLGGGAVYLVLALYGFLTDQVTDANFVPVNTADDWLHLGLAAGMIGLGAVAKAAHDRAAKGRTSRA
jgi:hypothetical protein